MPTKDPHIAQIDAQEKLHNIRMGVRQAIAEVRRQAYKTGRFGLTADDKHAIAVFRQRAIDATRRVQEEFLEEIESHGKLTES